MWAIQHSSAFLEWNEIGAYVFRTICRSVPYWKHRQCGSADTIIITKPEDDPNHHRRHIQTEETTTAPLHHPRIQSIMALWTLLRSRSVNTTTTTTTTVTTTTTTAINNTASPPSTPPTLHTPHVLPTPTPPPRSINIRPFAVAPIAAPMNNRPPIVAANNWQPWNDSTMIVFFLVYPPVQNGCVFDWINKQCVGVWTEWLEGGNGWVRVGVLGYI
jgi:hypothetical protein